MEKGNWSNCVTRYYYNHRYFTAVTAAVVVVVIVVDCPGCWKLFSFFFGLVLIDRCWTHAAILHCQFPIVFVTQE